MAKYTITLYKGEFPTLVWNPGKKEFRVLDPSKLPPESYETLIPDTHMGYQNTDERYSRNCEIFIKFLVDYALSSAVPVDEIIRKCDGSDESVINAYHQLYDGLQLLCSHEFVLTPGDCSDILRY